MRLRVCLKCGFQMIARRRPPMCPKCWHVSIEQPNKQISAQPERAAKEVHPTTPEQGQSE